MSQRSGDDGPVDYNEFPPPPPPPTEPPAQRSGVQPPAENLPPPPPSQPLDTIQPSSATISRAPVRYTLPPPPEDIPASEAELEAVFAQEQPAEEPDADEDAPRSLRPGQKGFAERLLAKYGWTKGSGLGATGSGIAKPLQVKVEKQKKRPDSEGGGFVTPAGRGKIIGGKRKGGEDEGKFGAMTEVIVLRGMLDGMDLEAELAGEGGGLMQEIGEECSEKVICSFRIHVPFLPDTDAMCSTEAWNASSSPEMRVNRSRSSSSSPVHYLLYGYVFLIVSSFWRLLTRHYMYDRPSMR